MRTWTKFIVSVSFVVVAAGGAVAQQPSASHEEQIVRATVQHLRVTLEPRSRLEHVVVDPRVLRWPDTARSGTDRPRLGAGLGGAPEDFAGTNLARLNRLASEENIRICGQFAPEAGNCIRELHEAMLLVSAPVFERGRSSAQIRVVVIDPHRPRELAMIREGRAVPLIVTSYVITLVREEVSWKVVSVEAR
jgi:hypothetical protein